MPRAQMELTFNLGVGMVAVVPAERARRRAQPSSHARGVPAWQLGAVGADTHKTTRSPDPTGQVQMAANYAGTAGFWG